MIRSAALAIAWIASHALRVAGYTILTLGTLVAYASGLATVPR